MVKSFVMSLLYFLQFHDLPMYILSNCAYEAEWRKNHNICSSVEHMIVDADGVHEILFSAEKNHASELREDSHIAGKLFSSAHHNHALIKVSTLKYAYDLIAVRVVGTRFTLYKVVVTKDGILACEDERSPKLDQMIIRRYPKATDNGWDFCDASDRLKILKMLITIKQTYAASFDQVDCCICWMPRFSQKLQPRSHVAENLKHFYWLPRWTDRTSEGNIETILDKLIVM